MAGADPRQVSDAAKRRQRDEMGTLGSGNHYLEVQRVTDIHDRAIAEAFGLAVDDIVVSIHCGSRGLGHQIGTEFLREMAIGAQDAGIDLPDRELACAPMRSALGERYLGAMRAAINCALANRQILTHMTRRAFRAVLPASKLDLLYDVSHNTCKVEDARRRRPQARAVRPPQGRDARLRPGASGSADGVLPDRAAGAHRRQHGDRFVRPRRYAARCEGGVSRRPATVPAAA